MNKLVLGLLGATFLTAFTSAYAYSSQVNRAHTVNFTAGAANYYFADRRHLENATVLPFGTLGYNFTEVWGIEGLLATFHVDSTKPTGNERQVSGTLFLIDGIYRFLPWQMFQPFITAGVGILGLSPNGTSANNLGNINAGIGLQLFVHPTVAFRVDARDLYTINGGYNDTMLDAGITFQWDLC